MLLSGFGSGPETLRPLGEALRDAVGATVLLAALPRHTGDRAAFVRSRAWHYVAEAEAGFLRFAAESDERVVLGGYSTGALVALVLAARHPARVAGLVLASPALRLSRTDRTLVAYTVGSLYYVGLPLALLGGLAAAAWGGRERGWTRHRRLLQAFGVTAIAASAAAGLRALSVPLRVGGPILTPEGEEVLPPHFTRASLLTGSSLLPLQLVARWRLRRIGPMRPINARPPRAATGWRFSARPATANRRSGAFSCTGPRAARESSGTRSWAPATEFAASAAGGCTSSTVLGTTPG